MTVPFTLVGKVNKGRGPMDIDVTTETVAVCPECAAIVGWPVGYDHHSRWHDQLNDQLRSLGQARP